MKFIRFYNRFRKDRFCLLWLIVLIMAPLPVSAAVWSGYLAAEMRLFNQSPRDPRQKDSNLSMAFEPEFYHKWDEGNHSLTFKPFFRLDQGDGERTHADLRELLWIFTGEGWELRAGIGKVFWGVTESVHLVDIVNQTDLVENPDGEQKLGQPMVKLSWERDWGVVDLFLLPGFRERTFPGVEGRLRTLPLVATDRARYESSAEDTRLDMALRWSHVLGDWDIGLAHFYGTGRDPSLSPGIDNYGSPILIPLYDIIQQTSLDLQATKGSWLWKLELIRRSGQGEAYWAGAGGFEYTRVGIFDSLSDLGILAEFLYDDRGDQATTPFENDLFLGLRWTANDAQSTELLTGIIADLDSSARGFNLEASRRIGQNWKASLQMRAWWNMAEQDPLKPFERDDYTELTLSRYF